MHLLTFLAPAPTAEQVWFGVAGIAKWFVQHLPTWQCISVAGTLKQLAVARLLW
jgi:hypothetical protein